MSRFNGPVLVAEEPRLEAQHEEIRNLMLDGHWRSLSEIAYDLGYPEASISAQLRHLRKQQYGAYRVNKRRAGQTLSGLWEYQVERPQ